MSSADCIHHGPFGRVGFYKLDRPIAPHAHREMHLVFYVNGGQASARVNGLDYRLQPQSGVVINVMETHSFIPSVDNQPCGCLVFYLRPEWVLAKSKNTAQLLRFGTTTIRQSATMSKMLRKLTEHLVRGEIFKITSDALYTVFVHSFHRSWSGLDLSEASFPPLASTRTLRSLQFLESRYASSPTSDLLARDIDLSRPYLFELFKKEVGSTPNIYSNALRIEHAVQELVMTDKSVESIAWDLGFSSQSSFSRFFSSNVGVPPTVYRRASLVLPSNDDFD